ncbi:uncharacterized protein LTR77_009053 [Saxophila tyrrhenica]|uniref:Vegetative cell wall protein gp1 n=1 Tax=Saxophila tyrrhenica TaxID=1690608 RepID=A0AAV9P371_9PEZI|nr:hypothetical protein LTR77_009053 [Saxophila tyrrhenica]
MQTAGYAVPPYFSYDYRSPPQTPQRASGYAYFSPRQYSTPATAPKGHTRRPTADATYTYNTTTYSTPRKSNYYSTPDYASAKYYNTSAQSTPQRKSDYVSGYAYTHERRMPAHDDGKKQRKYSSSQHYSTRPQYVYDGYSDREYEYLPRYEQYEAPPPSYRRHQSYCESRTDRRYYDQVPIYTHAEPTESTRPRRASYSQQNAKPTYTSTPRRPSTATKPPPKATAEDARQAGIPAGYCYKNWDPTEEPILLLGSVFDANSLGKWIYDWTVFFYGAATPMSEVAGDLWLLLIQLAGKVKRAEECMPRIRQTASRELVDDFLESGERLWQRFNRLLKICENYMWKAAKKESGSTAKVRMGKNSGCEFVDAIFGRDRELERTEKLMTSMRLWSMRFDANCEDILRHPAA